MKKVLLVFFVFSFVTVFQSRAQEASIGEFEFGTNVENRQIVGVDSVFSPNVDRVYCFTQIDGMDDNTTITHVWYYNNVEKAHVELPVNGNHWRTWSSKYILESWTGKWRVDVLNPNGDVLATKSFRIGQRAAAQ